MKKLTVLLIALAITATTNQSCQKARAIDGELEQVVLTIEVTVNIDHAQPGFYEDLRNRGRDEAQNIVNYYGPDNAEITLVRVDEN